MGNFLSQSFSLAVLMNTMPQQKYHLYFFPLQTTITTLLQLINFLAIAILTSPGENLLALQRIVA